ncbi:hypothetical protein [Pseudomonas sp. MPB26]
MAFNPLLPALALSAFALFANAASKGMVKFDVELKKQSPKDSRSFSK